AAGPASSLILAAASAGITLGLIALDAGRLPAAVFAAFAWINIVLAVLNLLPGSGLDGGRLIQALAWARSGDRARAAITAARAGRTAAGGAGARLGLIGASAFPLRDFEGHAAGLLTLSQLALVPAGQRDRLRLAEVATPVAEVVTTTPDEPLGQLLPRLSIRP